MNEEMFVGNFAIDLKPHNFEIYMGEKSTGVYFSFYVERNLGNRLKYWLFCKFFPFKISRWD